MALYFKTKITTNLKSQELIADLLFDIYNSKHKNLFNRVKIIVANNTMAEWIKYRITDLYNICANLDFLIYPEVFITSVYVENNPFHKLFDFEKATFIIFNFFNNRIIYDDQLYHNLKTFIFDKNNNLQIYRVYQLSLQLKKIFF